MHTTYKLHNTLAYIQGHFFLPSPGVALFGEVAVLLESAQPSWKVYYQPSKHTKAGGSKHPLLFSCCIKLF